MARKNPGVARLPFRAPDVGQCLFKQRARLADAERTLQTKTTKAATESRRIATDKIEWTSCSSFATCSAAVGINPGFAFAGNVLKAIPQGHYLLALKHALAFLVILAVVAWLVRRAPDRVLWFPNR